MISPIKRDSYVPFHLIARFYVFLNCRFLDILRIKSQFNRDPLFAYCQYFHYFLPEKTPCREYFDGKKDEFEGKERTTIDWHAEGARREKH